MRKNYCCILMFLLCAVWSMVPVSAQDRAIEIKGDRTMLYPQKMELTGEETLLDILLRYPEMLECGFNDLLTNYEPETIGMSNSGYQLRMDNVAIAGNMRNVLSTIKAKDVKQVQVCDNPAVAKGTGGLKGVIDVNMLRAKEGINGQAEILLATDGMMTPVVNVLYGSEQNDLFFIASHDKPAHADGQDVGKNYMFAEMTSRITPKDKLLSYFSLQHSSQSADKALGIAENSSRNLLARFRWFHTFNEIGTELLTLVGYQYQKAPSADVTNAGFYRRQVTKTDTPMLMLELNTPLFTKDLTMMLGWEADFATHHFSLAQNNEAVGFNFGTEDVYRVYNNDLYLQFNYVKGAFRFTLGDRIQFYHYGMNSQHDDKWSHNVARNMWQASVVATPAKQHQVQLAYNRKVIHPAYAAMMPEYLPTASGSFVVGNPDLDATLADVYKLAYGFSSKKLTAKAGASIIHTKDYVKSDEMDWNINSWCNLGESDTWKLEASASYTSGSFSLSAGANYYTIKPKDADKSINFATGRLSSIYKMTKDMHLNATLLLFSNDAPVRQAHNNCCAYGQLMLSKYFGRHFKTSVQWHDIFESQRSACLGSVCYIF